MRYLPLIPQEHKAIGLAGLVVLALLGVEAVFGGRGVLHLQRLHTQQEKAEAIVFRIADENRQLREHLDRLDHDDSYLEELARERLGWIRPGERVYRVHSGNRAPADGEIPIRSRQP